jgi:hypothetical protein
VLLIGGVVLAAAALLASVLQRRDEEPAFGGGNFAVCAKLEGDPARACYNREVTRELAAIGGASPSVSFAAPSDAGELTFTSTEAPADPLLCDLHARVGVLDEQTPSWLGWTEPVVAES